MVNNFMDKASNMMEENETEIIKAVQQGEQASYGKLVTLYKERVWRSLAGIVRNPHDAEDLTQEVFIKAYKHIGDFQFKSSFFTWIYRILVNTAIDFKRKQARQKLIPVDEEQGGIDVLMKEAVHPPRERFEPEERESGQLLKQAIDEMEPLHRSILVMRELEGFSYAEIGEILKIHSGTVMSRLFNARKKLKEILEKMEIV
jgi:RNA polymerase sigma-70 factor, ECF subfamily